MLWKKREAVLSSAPSIGIEHDYRLITPEDRQTVLSQIVAFADREQLSTDQKNGLAAELARRLGVDYTNCCAGASSS